MTKTVQGIVHGKTIELAEELGMAEGQQVEVHVTAVPVSNSWGAGLQRAAGALAAEWTADDDRILDEIHKDRHSDSRRELLITRMFPG